MTHPNLKTPSPSLRLPLPTKALIVLLLALIAAIILLASVPPVDRDSLTHHLYVPRLYLDHGGMVELPDVEFSYFPMNLELLYLVPLALGNDIIPKYIHFLFALLSALLIHRWLAAALGRTWALAGALFFLSLPVVVKLSITAYVDLGLIFFSGASLLLLLTWGRDIDRTRWLLLAGLCAGLAVGTKYNGLITLLLLALFVPVLHQRCAPPANRSAMKALLSGAIFVAAALLAFSPWAIRNIIWTGNPLYPLFGAVFGTEETAVLGGMNFFLIRKFLYHESLWQTLLIPLRIFFQGQDDNPQFFDGQLNPALLFLPLFAFIVPARDKQEHIEKLALAAFALLYILLAFFQRDLRIRYIGPALVPLVLLSMFGLRNLLARATTLPRPPVRALACFGLSLTVAAAFFLNARYLVTQFTTVRPLSYLTGAVSREMYITRYWPEFAVYQFANQHLNKEERILCIFTGNRGYYLNAPHFFDFRNNKSLLTDIINQADKPEDIVNHLHAKGFTHLIFREDLWQQWIGRNLSEEKINLFRNYISQSTSILFRHDHYLLLETGPRIPK